MNSVDFDQLCVNAYRSDASLKDKDSLWLEVFKLKAWCFVARGSMPDVQPYIGEANEIEADTNWLYAFTDLNRATFFAKKNHLSLENNSSPILEVPNSEELIPWIEDFKNNGAKGIFFNAEGNGFFVPIEQLKAIKDHLTTSFPDQM